MVKLELPHINLLTEMDLAEDKAANPRSSAPPPLNTHDNAGAVCCVEAGAALPAHQAPPHTPPPPSSPPRRPSHPPSPPPPTPTGAVSHGEAGAAAHQPAD
jgi:hypothetical protein